MNNDKLHNGWTPAEFEDLKRTSPEYADLSKDEVRTLLARYGGSMFKELRAGQPTPAARAQALANEEERKAENHYARLRASTAALAERNKNG